MTFITWPCLRCVQELATILGPQNPTQRSCDVRYVMVCKFRKFCGEHRGWTDEANNAEIEEFSHNQVEEEGDIPCRDAVTNQDRMPGDSWLSEDSCNICTCTGTHRYI